MADGRRWVKTWMGILAWAALASIGRAAPPSESQCDGIHPLLQRYCLDCHSGDQPKGKLSLDALSWAPDNPANRGIWHRVLERLEVGDMPPPEVPRPTQSESSAAIDWLGPRIAAAEAQARQQHGRVPLRRLNRSEYQNTLRDLLGVEVNFKEQLPPDSSADGFDNAAAAHHTSSFLMEKYLEAADTALQLAISNKPQPPISKTNKYSLKDGHPVRGTTEDVYRIAENGEVTCLCSSEWHNVTIPHFYPQEPGVYRFRISASAVQSDGKPVTFRVTTTGTRLNGMNGLVGYFDAPPNKPHVFEFVRRMEPRTSISLLPYGLAGANTVKQVGAKDWPGAGLAIQYVEVEGPLNEVWPPHSHRQLFGDLPQQNFPAYNARDRVEVVSDQPMRDAKRLLSDFLRRAYRRRVTTDDVAPFVTIVETKLADNHTFEQAMRAAFKGVMISPEFLFLQERPGKLDDFALASRLSYFLWSSMPDEQLFALAEQGKLQQPAVLHEQVERMLDDPKARALTENFVGQWLGTREIDATEPSHLLYPEFDHLLKVSMVRETELFFDELLKHDLSLNHFIASDFAMLNGRLAKHYGIPDLEGWEFKKTVLPAGSHRGGVLTMAAVLKVTANGTSTSPVMRGAWVLDRILGKPPAPPPDNISAIDPDIRGATTIREQLAKHRSTESCGVCHRQMDPPGFALESFDCIGGWRDRYRVTGNGDPVTIDGKRALYRLGKPVEPADRLATGEPFADIDEFKQLLLRERRQFAHAFTSKLLTYATGKAPLRTDRTAVADIVAVSAKNDYGLRSLLHAIVQSQLFQHK